MWSFWYKSYWYGAIYKELLIRSHLYRATDAGASDTELLIRSSLCEATDIELQLQSYSLRDTKKELPIDTYIELLMQATNTGASDI